MSKSLIGVIIAVVVVIVLAVVLGLSGERPGEPGVVSQESPPEQTLPGKQLVVNLAEQNGSGIYGAAILTETQEGLLVVLGLAETPKDTAQPAHIHKNTCENIGGVLYSLESPVNGSSETILSTTIDELLAQAPLSINVHKSAQEPQVYVACGNIES